jgi:hypothetical protein
MGKCGGRQSRHVLIRDRFPGRAQLREYPRHVDGIPHQHGVGQQTGYLGATEQRTGLRAGRGSEFTSKPLSFVF